MNATTDKLPSGAFLNIRSDGFKVCWDYISREKTIFSYRLNRPVKDGDFLRVVKKVTGESIAHLRKRIYSIHLKESK